jgi:dipeptidyl aminopeptidase/acylaminoacyl peptidase
VSGTPIDIMLGEKFDCPLQPHGGDDDYAWSKDGNMLAYSCKKENGTQAAFSTNSDIYLYSLNDKSTINVSFRNSGYDRAPQFSTDGNKLAWLSMKKPGYESDKNNLKIYHIKPINLDSKKGIKASVEPVENLTSNFDYTIDEFQWMDASRVVFISIKEGTKNFFVYDPKSKNINNIFQVTKADQDYSGFSFGVDGKKPVLVGCKTRMDMPAEVFFIDLLSGKEKQISFSNAEILKNTKMGRVEKRWIKATDGKQILTWVIYPPDFDASKKYPTLLYCQGGPQSPVSQSFSYRWNFQLMAANDYIVVAPNRRGLPGFGSEWNDAIQGDYGGQCMKDYLSAIDAVATEPFVNKDKLGAVGASFGGYSVYWLAGHHERKFKAFIAHCGMFNMESWYGSTEEMFFANNDNNGPYWNQPHPNNFDASPHKFVQNWNTPILIIHNEKDFRVPVTQGMEAFTAAQTMGVPSKFLYFPDENHWVTKPQNSILWQRVFFEWLDQWLKDIPQKSK